MIIMKPFCRIVLILTVTCAIASAQPAPATTQSASVTPNAAKVLDAMNEAYSKLTGLELAGKITGDFDVDGQQENQTSEFSTTFAAPNKFRHKMAEEGLIGSTGEKLYVYTKGRNAYLSVDAPKEKVPANDLPDPFADLLGAQNLSLALAISPDPAAELKRTYAKIDKGPAVALDSKSYTALTLTSRKGEATTTLLVDPESNLLRRASMDLAPEMKSRGAKDVKKALITIDYTTTTANGPAKPNAFAWTPPAGAKDAAEITEGDAGGDVADHILKDKPAPDFKLKGLDDKEVALADLKGSVVVLDFWATWCGPCVASLPKLDKLAKDTAEQGVKIFAVNQGEDKELVQGFMKSKNLTVPVLLDSDSKVGNKYKAQAIPETVIIGKDGIVRAVFVGSGSEDKIRKAVEEAIK